MRRLIATALLWFAALIGSAAAQQNVPVYITGALTPGHALALVQSGAPGAAVVQDAGPALAGNFTEIGITNTGTPFCIRDSAGTSGHIACLGANSLGGGLISYNPFGGASSLPMSANINGVNYPFPFAISGIVGPSSTVPNDGACWNNTNGTLLKDCGSPPLTGPPSSTVGDIACWNNISGTALADCGVFPYPFATGAVITSGTVNPSTATCGRRYDFNPAVGQSITVNIPAATSVPIGCSFEFFNAGAVPAYNESTFVLTGGREVKFTGLNFSYLYPQVYFKLVSNGATWDGPTTQPVLVLPAGLNSSNRFRVYVSTTGSSTNSGLGGCGGSPFDSIQTAALFLTTGVDWNGNDAVTVQLCAGSYAVGSQQLHMANEPLHRNGQFGIRFTGSPGGPQVCPDAGVGVVTTANSTTPTYDTEMQYTSIVVDCQTLNTQGAPVATANRLSALYLSTGTQIGAGAGSSGTQVAANNATLYLDGSTTLVINGDEAGSGSFGLLQNGAKFINLGGNFNFAANASYSYTAFWNLGQNSAVSLGGATFTFQGSNGLSGKWAIADGNSSVTAANAIPHGGAYSGYTLTNGSCLSGAINACAIPAAVRSLTTVASPGAISSTSPAKMLGLAGSFTPTYSGNLRVDIVETLSQSTANDSCGVQIYYGTGTAPGNNVNIPAGASSLNSSKIYSAAANNQSQIASMTGYAAALTLGTAYWIDESVQVGAGGQCTATNVDVVVTEE